MTAVQIISPMIEKAIIFYSDMTFNRYETSYGLLADSS